MYITSWNLYIKQLFFALGLFFALCAPVQKDVASLKGESIPTISSSNKCVYGDFEVNDKNSTHKSILCVDVDKKKKTVCF